MVGVVYRMCVNTALDTLKRAAVRQAVLTLSASSRAVVVLRECGGLSYHEIADARDGSSKKNPGQPIEPPRKVDRSYTSPATEDGFLGNNTEVT